MPVIEPTGTWSHPCPKCGGNIRRELKTANRVVAAKVGESSYWYACENETGKTVARHVPVNWQPPSD